MNNEKHFTRQVTVEEMTEEIKREIGMRRTVYPNRILSGKSSERIAAFRLPVLEAILIKLPRELKETAPQKELFK